MIVRTSPPPRPCTRRRFRASAALAASALFLAAAGAVAQDAPLAPPRGETPAAREQARLCEIENGETGLAACRAALALGIGPERRGAVRDLIAKHLVALERWGELAAFLREEVRLSPDDPATWQRLGTVLLLAQDAVPEALAALEEAARLAPKSGPIHLALALALQAAGRPSEAAGVFEEAERMDPNVFDGRPASRAAFEAARRGERWP
jgi:tetratricopeptide (TPR) repeat protein